MSLINSADDAAQTIWLIVGGIACFIGLAVAFFGYRLLRPTLAMLGLLIGAALGGAIAMHLQWQPVEVGVPAAAVIGALAGGAAGLLYRVGLFLLGGTSGVLLAAMGMSVFAPGLQPMWMLAALAAAALIGGSLVLWLQRVVVILASGLVGGLLAAVGGAIALGYLQPPTVDTQWLEQAIQLPAATQPMGSDMPGLGGLADIAERTDDAELPTTLPSFGPAGELVPQMPDLRDVLGSTGLDASGWVEPLRDWALAALGPPVGWIGLGIAAAGVAVQWFGTARRKKRG
jgi:hypothetical protein